MAKKGGQPGNTNASIGRQARHALELALKNFDIDNPEDPYEKLNVIGSARTLVMMWKPIITAALVEGDLAALKEINDRLDGKAMQSIDIADVSKQRANELSDDELTDIATRSS